MCSHIDDAWSRTRTEFQGLIAFCDHDWDLVNWSCCLFTDKSKFRLYTADGRILVRRKRGRQCNENFIAPTTSFGGESVWICGGICFGRRTDLLVLMNASMTSVRYRYMAVEPIIVPFAGAIGEGFVLIDDNAHPHLARILNQ